MPRGQEFSASSSRGIQLAAAAATATAATRMEETGIFKAKITNNHPSFFFRLVRKMIFIFRKFNSVKICHIIGR